MIPNSPVPFPNRHLGCEMPPGIPTSSLNQSGSANHGLAKAACFDPKNSEELPAVSAKAPSASVRAHSETQTDAYLWGLYY